MLSSGRLTALLIDRPGQPNLVCQFAKYFFITLCVCVILPSTASSETQPIAVDGVLDLRGWDFEKDTTVALKGIWRVAWEDFKTETGEDTLKTQYPHTINMPGQWNTLSDSPDGNLGAITGYATYVLDVILPTTINTEDLALHVNSANPATRWTIFGAGESHVLGQMHQGLAGPTYASTRPLWIPASTTLGASKTHRIRIQAHVSNFRYPTGGFNDAPQLGLKEAIEQSEVSRFFLNSLTLGILIIIAWYHFILYLQRREDKASLAFALWCVTFILRTTITARFPQLLSLYPESLNFEVLVALEFISIPLTVAGCGYFLHALMPTRISKQILIWSGLSSAALIFMTMVTSQFFFAANLLVYQAHLFVCAIAFSSYLFSQIKKPETQAAWVLFAFLILVLGAANDALHSQNLIQSGYIVHYAFIAFVFLQSAILSSKFAKTYERAAHLSLNLQEEVAIQTDSLIKTSNREIEHAKTLLAQSEKLSQLGVMIASIGHEIVNPVSVISSSLMIQQETIERLKERLNKDALNPSSEASDSESLDKDFQNLNITYKASRTSVEKLLEMTHALGTQSRTEINPTQAVCVNEIVKEVIVLTAGRVNVHDLRQKLGEIPLITCYRSKIGQILINLLVNASDAVDSLHKREKKMGIFRRGKIDIVTRSQTTNDIAGVLIEISDSGDGVPQELRDKIFTEFFTTKDAGAGTGLGLAICDKITRQHGGCLSVTDSTELGGAKFELWLPIEIQSTESQKTAFL